MVRVTSVCHVLFMFSNHITILVQANLFTGNNQTQSIGSVIEANRARTEIIAQSN